MIAFQIVDAPAQFPGACIDGTSEGPVVDTHFMLAEQRLYLNARIIREAAVTGILRPRDVEAVAVAYGLLTDEQRQQLEDRATEAEASVRDLETRIAELAPVEAALARAASKYPEVDA